ncbi:MAG: hypothetical protein EA351_11330, partial [Gemmatimonadales bacterium]
MKRSLLALLPLVAFGCADLTSPSADVDHDALMNRGGGGSPAATYSLVDLGTLGGNASFALGLNNRGDVVGTARTTGAPRPQLAFVTGSEGLSSLGTLEGSTFSRAFRINQKGEAVGEAFAATGGSRAVLWSEGTLVELAPGQSAVANDINNRGQIVGTSGGQAVLWEQGGMTGLGAISSDPNATSRGNAIAENGRVVGLAQTDVLGSFGSRVSHAFLWDGRRMIDLGALADETNFSNAFGVNSRSDVVGESSVGDGTSHAFLWRNGHIQSLHPEQLGIRHSRANDINASGQVVGWASTFYGFPTFGNAAAVLWSGNQAFDLNTLVDADGWDLRAA